jgi:CRP/FNR family cyclic AMP-dependent transcriptional regulator
VTPGGVALRVPLTHHLLAEIVGAERPTVTTALGCLKDAGLIEPIRGRERGWLLAGEPPGEVCSPSAGAGSALLGPRSRKFP